MTSERARELLAAEWEEGGEQFAEIRRRIRDGSCRYHSDPVSLANTIALRAIEAALSNREAVKALRNLLDGLARQESGVILECMGPRVPLIELVDPNLIGAARLAIRNLDRKG